MLRFVNLVLAVALAFGAGVVAANRCPVFQEAGCRCCSCDKCECCPCKCCCKGGKCDKGCCGKGCCKVK